MPSAKYPKPIRRYPCTVPLSEETYLEAKHRQAQLVELARKVANIKSCVDTGPPKTHVSVKVKLKKLMEEGLKLAELEFNNRLMLKRIINAMNAPATTDNHLNIQNRPFSLNFGARMMEADRINAENFRTLTRILQVKPCYDRIKQEQSYRHLTKDRKSSKDVIKLWKKLAHERKKEIMEGGPAASRYGHEDPDVLRARSAGCIRIASRSTSRTTPSTDLCLPSAAWTPTPRRSTTVGV
ncbi:uncharacterized protein LOC112560471 isoform X2 [Pomacea canaliculata]|uniref:uncharacterized protein LOC112560471 isoform X2 n=1 Tax=Pomacea canaliculata TaxID=400727 RepID=UPI000D73A0A9|nr:uncharacterized protein LOC112560471 isoform X2 [Pomacea canaliculata]